MGILRSDRVSGLGGANAIKGSVEMRAGQNMRVEIVNGNADYNLGSSNFTIECWYNPGGTTGTANSLDVDLLMLWNNTNNRRSYGLYYDSSGSLGLIGSSDGTNSDMQSFHSYTFSDVNAWYHIAVVRISNTATVYVNGAVLGSATVSGSFYENTVDNLVVGGQLAGTSYDSKIARGFISNMRLIIGDGIYTGAFTPPANELTVTPNTKLLCCQSPGNILQEATGKTLVAYRSSANDSFAKASHFAPDKGEDYGTTFADNTKFDTLSYMVPPGGTTAERGRDRGVMMGGMEYPTVESNIIEYIRISSGGMTKDFGDLTQARGTAGGASSSTRGVMMAGLSGPTRRNTMDYITIATTGNALDFGDYIEDLGYVAGLSNQTRGVSAGGNGPNSPSNTNQIGYITIATTGNASDFGDLTTASGAGAAAASPTRGLFAIGYTPSFVNTIDYITIASTGNAADFGDMTRTNASAAASCSSQTRGLFAGGYNNTPAPSTEVNNIDYVTIASTGNAADFGDLTVKGMYFFATSNGTRGIFTGRQNTGPTNYGDPTIDSVIIATLGNAVDWGEMYRMESGPDESQPVKRRAGACVSDSHGGLS